MPATLLELASGIVSGEHAAADELPDPGLLSPAAALERSALVAVSRPPCLVSFSGGRDSSLVLAVATRVARQEGLADPVPATLVFPTSPESRESQWQELVVRALGLGEWHRHEMAAGQLDLVGPVATEVLRNHGPLWPPNAHLHVPLLELAAGGSFLTGLDGDGLLGDFRWTRAAAVLTGKIVPRPRDAVRMLHALAPVRLRTAWARRRTALELDWLLPPARAVVAQGVALDEGTEPLVWRRRAAWWRRRRYLALLEESFGLLARDAGTALVHPLLDPLFVAAMARAGGVGGFAGRTAALKQLFGGLVPEGVYERQDKASFDTALWGAPSRSFRARWRGGGIPETYVDIGELRTAWNDDVPHFGTALLLQSAWLASDTEAEQAIGDSRQLRPAPGAT